MKASVYSVAIVLMSGSLSPQPPEYPFVDSISQIYWYEHLSRPLSRFCVLLHAFRPKAQLACISQAISGLPPATVAYLNVHIMSNYLFIIHGTLRLRLFVTARPYPMCWQFAWRKLFARMWHKFRKCFRWCVLKTIMLATCQKDLVHRATFGHGRATCEAHFL